MKSSRTGRWPARLPLVLAGAVLVGLGHTVRADAPTASAQKVQAAFLPQTATVKLGSAMLQERSIGADGTIHTESYLDAMPTQSAKASQPTGANAQVTAKA